MCDIILYKWLGIKLMHGITWTSIQGSICDDLYSKEEKMLRDQELLENEFNSDSFSYFSNNSVILVNTYG